MNTIQTGRFNRLFQKLFAIKGPANLTEVGAEVLPIIPVRIGNECRALESWERFALTLQVTGGAAQNPAQRFRNPAGSKVLAVIEKILLIGVGPAVDSFQVSMSNAAADRGTLGVNIVKLDLRQGRIQPTCIISSDVNSGALVGTQFLGINLNVGVSYDLVLDENQELTILPGQSFDVRNNIAQQTVAMSVVWRERSMEEAELSL